MTLVICPVEMIESRRITFGEGVIEEDVFI